MHKETTTILYRQAFLCLQSCPSCITTFAWPQMPSVVVRLPIILVWYFPNSRFLLDTRINNALIYWCIRQEGLGSILAKQMASSRVVPWASKAGYCLKELYAVMCTCTANTWDHNWARKTMLFHCNNNTVVSNWNKRSTYCREIMTPVHMLHFCAACYDNIHHRHWQFYSQRCFLFPDGSLQTLSSTFQSPCRYHLALLIPSWVS